jgi:hypothetical protein
MTPIPLPTGWVSVGTGAGDLANRTRCAALLAGATGASGDSTATTEANLKYLLKTPYSEPLAAPAGFPTQQPLFYLYYRANTVLTDICVAFYKTIKRGAIATSAGGTPTRRWWCISVGVITQNPIPAVPAPGWSYPYVRDLCSYFYYAVVFAPPNQAFGDILVTAEDHNRPPNPAAYEVDQCSSQLANDALVQKNSVSAMEAAYPPWKHLRGAKQVDFTQLTF